MHVCAHTHIDHTEHFTSWSVLSLHLVLCLEAKTSGKAGPQKASVGGADRDTSARKGKEHASPGKTHPLDSKNSMFSVPSGFSCYKCEADS